MSGFFGRASRFAAFGGAIRRAVTAVGAAAGMQWDFSDANNSGHILTAGF